MKGGQPRNFVERHEGKLVLIATLAQLALIGALGAHALAKEIETLDNCIAKGAITEKGSFIKPGPAYDPTLYPECYRVIEASKVLRFFGPSF